MTSTIRTLTLAEVGTLLDWAATEGWNPGLDDALPFQAADPAGFFGAFVDDRMVAGIAAVAYDARFGFIGLYICHRDWRGQGHGKAVWDAGMAYLGNRTIGLDGVPEQQANYATMGFVAAYETIRMSGPSPTGMSAPARAASDLDGILALDQRCFPAVRQNFLRHWLDAPRQSAVSRKHGEVQGYAVSRACRDGSKIGPLFAQDLDVALNLLTMQHGTIHIDVPATQVEWLKQLSAQGFTQGFATRRMYRGTAPTIHMPAIFGISTLELG